MMDAIKNNVKFSSFFF